jgi:hypothetical protein
MSSFSGTGNIRQQAYTVNLSTYGIPQPISEILATPSLNTFYYYQILGSGPQSNRIRNFRQPRPPRPYPFGV